jgi:DNA (cytosine-5)-methyltransferase 1
MSGPSLTATPRDTAAAVEPATTLEMFAGAGGLALGFHQAGFELLDLLEKDAGCCATLRANADRLGWKAPAELRPRDVRDVAFSDYAEQVTVLTAGAPCQPFSRGGHRLGRLDARDMLPEVVRAVAEARPKAFVVENVRGLLFGDSIHYLRTIVRMLRNPSDASRVTPSEGPLPRPGRFDEYRVEYRLLDAADFGLAQHRPRLFIVGIRADQPAFAWPTRTHSRASLMEDLRDGTYWAEHPGVSAAARGRACARLPRVPLHRDGQRWRTLRDLTREVGAPATRPNEVTDPSHILVRGARLYGKHTGSPVDWAAKTVKAGVHGSPGGEHILVTSPGRFRYLTVRECALLQGFPFDYRLPDKRTPAMRQLGNAVPVRVAAILAHALSDTLSPASVRAPEVS